MLSFQPHFDDSGIVFSSPRIDMIMSDIKGVGVCVNTILFLVEVTFYRNRFIIFTNQQYLELGTHVEKL